MIFSSFETALPALGFYYLVFYHVQQVLFRSYQSYFAWPAQVAADEAEQQRKHGLVGNCVSFVPYGRNSDCELVVILENLLQEFVKCFFIGLEVLRIVQWHNTCYQFLVRTVFFCSDSIRDSFIRLILTFSLFDFSQCLAVLVCVVSQLTHPLQCFKRSKA